MGTVTTGPGVAVWDSVAYAGTLLLMNYLNTDSVQSEILQRVETAQPNPNNHTITLTYVDQKWKKGGTTGDWTTDMTDSPITEVTGANMVDARRTYTNHAALGFTTEQIPMREANLPFTITDIQYESLAKLMSEPSVPPLEQFGQAVGGVAPVGDSVLSDIATALGKEFIEYWQRCLFDAVESGTTDRVINYTCIGTNGDEGVSFEDLLNAKYQLFKDTLPMFAETGWVAVVHPDIARDIEQLDQFTKPLIYGDIRSQLLPRVIVSKAIKVDNDGYYHNLFFKPRSMVYWVQEWQAPSIAPFTQVTGTPLWLRVSEPVRIPGTNIYELIYRSAFGIGVRRNPMHSVLIMKAKKRLTQVTTPPEP